MAKGKDAAALFEVINRGKSYRTSADRSALRTPKWWWKRRAAAPPPPPAVVHEATAVHDPTEARTAPPAAPMPLAAPVEHDAVPPPADASLQVDPQRQELTLRLSYTGAIVLSFTVLVTIVLAFLVGKRMYDTVQPAQAARPTEQMLVDPPAPQVLEVSSAVRSVEPEDAALPLVEQVNAAPLNTPQPPPPVIVRDPRRQIGLNYVVIQSYPNEAEAIEAIDVLAQNGIQADVQRNLRGWNASWYSVVGIEGFTRISSTEFKQYVRKIDQVSQQYAGRKSWKAFSPQAYKWDRDK